MGTLRQRYHRVPVYDGATLSYRSSSDFEALPYTITASGQQYISKLSIQAPQGSEIEIDGKTIMIGRSGLYDLDNDNLYIHSITFLQPRIAVTTQISTDIRDAYANALNTIKSSLSATTDTVSFANKIIETHSISIPNVEEEKVFNIIELANAYNEARTGRISYDQRGGEADNIIINYLVEGGE